MKHIYSIFIIFFSINVSFSQAALEGDWYVHYISINNNLQYSSIPNSIEVTTINLGDSITFNSSICDTAHGGNFEYVSSNTLKLLDFSTLSGFCNSPIEEANFLNPYTDIFWNHVNENYNYTTSGNGLDETLTLTNSLGDFVFYGRQPLEQPDITGQWFLHGLVFADNTYQENIFSTGGFYTEFNLNPNSADEGIDFGGAGDCNWNFGGYFFSGPSTIEIIYMYTSLSTCIGPAANYEDYFFGVFQSNDETYQRLEIDISGEGDDAILTLTNLEGRQAIYGKQSLNGNLAGEWFLHSIYADFYTNYNTFSDNFAINFSSEYEPTYSGNYFFGNAICNEYFGTYAFSNNSIIEVPHIMSTLEGCNNQAENNFELIYFNAFQANDPNDNPVFVYNISGEGEDAKLYLYNLNNGNNITYGRQPLSTPDVAGTWYLQYIFDVDVIIDNSYNPNAYIEFVPDPENNTLAFNGTVVCNDYNATYNITAPSTMSMETFSYTDASCDIPDANNFEDLYFFMFNGSQNSNEQLNMSVSGDGSNQTLTLHNAGLDISSFYTRQPLSIAEFNTNTIKLKNNPVNSILEIIGLQSSKLKYNIYSIDGKTVLEGTQNSHTINVQDLASGVYFLKIDNKNVIKFIKK